MCFESPGIRFGGRDCLFYEGYIFLKYDTAAKV